MSLAPFAAIEALVNQGVTATLSNAIATFAGGEPFGVLFDRKAVDPLSVVATNAPQVAFDIAHAPGLVQTSVLVIDGVSYTVASGVEPDSSGWVTLDLRDA